MKKIVTAFLVAFMMGTTVSAEEPANPAEVNEQGYTALDVALMEGEEELTADMIEEINQIMGWFNDNLGAILTEEQMNQYMNNQLVGEAYQALNDEQKQELKVAIENLDDTFKSELGMSLQYASTVYEEANEQAAPAKSLEDEVSEEDENKENPGVPETGDGSMASPVAVGAMAGSGLSSTAYLVLGFVLMIGGMYVYEQKRA